MATLLAVSERGDSGFVEMINQEQKTVAYMVGGEGMKRG